MTDPDELVACCTCGKVLPAGVMYLATVGGTHQCFRCFDDADEFEDVDEHTRD